MGSGAMRAPTGASTKRRKPQRSGMCMSTRPVGDHTQFSSGWPWCSHCTREKLMRHTL